MTNETGTTIIDDLKICYTANLRLLEELKRIHLDDVKQYGDFQLCRTKSHHFEYTFDVICTPYAGFSKVATAYFGRYGDASDCTFFFYHISNFVLYDRRLLEMTITLPNQLGMAFHNFTSIDLAIDAKTDLARLIKRMWHRDDITTIINGKAVTDRKALLKNVALCYSASLDRLRGLTVYIKQAKAAHDKAKGTTVIAYNKLQEIKEVSHKEYIHEFYGYPAKLYRLEVHLNNKQIFDYFKDKERGPNMSLIFDAETLVDMFYYHLSKVIRFTKNRKKLSWKDIIKCNGRV